MEPMRPKNDHPLAHDEQVVSSRLLDELRRLNPQATLTELLLETTGNAQRVCRDFVRRWLTGETDLLLMKSILATAELHRRGATGKIQAGKRDQLTTEENALLDVACKPYNASAKKALLAAYKIDQYQALALDAYTNANKSIRILETTGKLNPHYMGEEPQLWGRYGDGWRALTSALYCIPTLGQLGIVLTTYRAPRIPKEVDEVLEIVNIAKLPVETNIHHGIVTMDMGQLHYISTGISYCYHWLRVAEVGGLVAITGVSGCYINPFGIQGWIDGAEVLYPPKLMTVFEGMNPRGYDDGRQQFPVAHLREVRGAETGQHRVDDHTFLLLSPKDDRLDARKMRLIRDLTLQDPAKVRQALSGLGYAERGIMYLTLDELERVRLWVSKT
ncbi:hypothetical protein [Rhizohabitans arisaemae]|uniref:hypothetical protein n=1 Tax=Rhizohabitans arisaemae TaxID=2720610 RepID=UPI0024B1A694|nr:hypothetical protein [Rhizohabitans arisaemae]